MTTDDPDGDRPLEPVEDVGPGDQRSPSEWRHRVARVIAVAFLSGDPQPAAMAQRAKGAIGDERDDWLEPLATAMAELLPALDTADPAELASLILRSDSFTYVARVQEDDGRDWEDREELGDDVAEVDPELATTLWHDDEPARHPWRADIVRSSPLDLPATPWTRHAQVEPLVPSAPDDEEGSRPDGRGPPTAPRAPHGLATPPRWPVPELDAPIDLAEHLGLHPLHLAWYADVRSMERDARDEPLRHYTYRWLPKRAGGARLLEMPKPMLRFFQRRILREIIDVVPAHPAAHGFRRGRSVATFAAPHQRQDTVIRLDLESFFASVRANRVFGIFRSAGYPSAVAHLLTGLATNTVPLGVRRAAPRPPAASVAAHRRTMDHLSFPHLPQGAPTSPALANLAAFRLDRRLTGLARSFDASYTRYADDLAFSGGHRLARHQRRFVGLATRIVADEGFHVNAAKTRVRRAGERQAVAGLVVNDHAQVPRHEYDRLRSVLHDAAVNGPLAADRADHPDFRAHLLGRIGWVATGNPTRAAKLRRRFDEVAW